MTIHDHPDESVPLSDEDEAFVEAADRDPYGIATEEGPTEGHVVNAFGGDWDDVVDEAASLGEERIVVNMGPQHPSTHGVLRLILEIDGETVTETRAGIGYLHTGIEKNMEYRTWTQGVTFCTRMDYLTPMFQETAYCLGVEKLLGITDQIPERASVIRVLMMELTRISSHLVALATGGLEMGATTVMTVGFRERERILAVIELITGLRMNNAYIRPGGVSQDIPSGAIDRIRDMIPAVKKGLGELEKLLLENPILKGRTVDVGYLDLTGCIALGITGPILRSTGLPHDLRKLDPYCGYETYDFDVVTRESADAYGRLCVRLDEMFESLRIIEQTADRLQDLTGPVMVEDKKIAWPAQLALGSDGLGNSLDHIKEIMGTSMESLIHHFKLVTEGFRVPPGQVYQAVESAKGEFGVHVVSDGGTRPYRAHFRDPSFNNLQSAAAMCEGSQIADVIVAVASIDPVMGGVDRWLAPDVEQRLRTEAVEVIARYPQARSALLPLLHLVQSEEGYVSPRGIELCADILDLSTAEVSGVATFYTQYKRHPNGEYTVGVCTNTLCAIMGGDQIFDELSEHLGVGHDETTEDGKITLERVECNAACDFAPVLMVNWEFFDNQTPGTARELVDDIQAGKAVVPTRGASSVADFKQVSRVLAGFDDHRADEGVGAAGATLEGLALARREGWQVDGLYDGKSSSSNGSGGSSAPSGGDRPPVEQIAADHVADPDAPSAHDAGSPAQEGRAPAAPATPAARQPRKRTTKKKDS